MTPATLPTVPLLLGVPERTVMSIMGWSSTTMSASLSGLGPRAGQMAGLSSSSALASRNGFAESTASA